MFAALINTRGYPLTVSPHHVMRIAPCDGVPTVADPNMGLSRLFLLRSKVFIDLPLTPAQVAAQFATDTPSAVFVPIQEVGYTGPSLINATFLTNLSAWSIPAPQGGATGTCIQFFGEDPLYSYTPLATIQAALAAAIAAEVASSAAGAQPDLTY